MKYYLIRVKNPNGLIWAYWKSDQLALMAFEDAADVLGDRLKSFVPHQITKVRNPSFLVFSTDCKEGR